MAQCFNPNGLTVNGMGVPVADRPVPTERQKLEDTLDLLRNSLRMMEDEPDLAAQCAEVRARVREIERALDALTVAEHLKAGGVVAITPAGFAAWVEQQFPDAVAECAEEFAALTAIIPAGTCPVCGLDLTERPHSETDCAEWFAEDYRDADETRADLWQF